MNSNHIIGQSTLIKGLKAIVDSGRVVHSYIFTGPEGVGKKTISDFFAKMLLCTDQDKPCNQCKSCRQFESGNQPDLIRLKSEKGVIRVDAIRDLRKDIGIKPYQGSRKVYIIEDGETMNQHAQNAFLKTLEEPEHINDINNNRPVSHHHIQMPADYIQAYLPMRWHRSQRKTQILGRIPCFWKFSKFGQSQAKPINTGTEGKLSSILNKKVPLWEAMGYIDFYDLR